MSTSDVVLRRYFLPNENHEGWAEIVIGSNGFFAAVSDYGNFAFSWYRHGCDDFRRFFLHAPLEWSYFANKLGTYEQTHEYDGDATRRNIQRTILSERRTRSISGLLARLEWDHVAEMELSHKDDFRSWVENQKLAPDAYELARYGCEPGLEAFCRRTLARLANILLAELGSDFREKSRAWFRGTCDMCRGRWRQCHCIPF